MTITGKNYTDKEDFENTQIYPPQASNLFTDLLMSYGVFIIIFIIIFIIS